MKTIIAGGRDYQLTEDDFRSLRSLHNQHQFTEVVSGGATGADRGGEKFGHQNAIPVKKFMADWKTHKRAAGPIRNKQMAEYADAVVLFHGGDGTQSMFNEATKAGIRIFDLRNGFYPTKI